MDPDRFRVNRERSAADRVSALPPAPPTRYQQEQKAPKKSNKWLWLVLAVVVVLVLGGGTAYVMLKSKTTKPKSGSSLIKKAVASKPTNVQPTAPVIPTNSHTSAAYGATFNYPSSWTVVDSGSAPLTVTSPVMNLISANGQTVLGQIVLTMANMGYLPTAFGPQSVAVLGSQKIVFSNASTAQAADTYISFVQYPATTIRGGLDGIYVSGNYGYQKFQNIPASNITTVNPFIAVTFLACASPSCPTTTRQPLTIAASDWSNQSFSAPILVMLKSFSFD